MQQVLVADDVVTWPSDEPQLIASERDGVLSFPARPGDPRRLLARRGTLWAFTSQQFRPVSPPYDGDDTAETFRPYTLGYVELPGELLVQGRFTEPDPARLHVGMEMEVVVVPYTTRPDGTEVLTYAFAPVEGAAVSASDVAIVGVGLHPFGRHGDKQALVMGAEATRDALADAGTDWSRVQTAFVGSHVVSNPDAIIGWLGLTGIPVRGVFNGCATGGTSLQMAAAAIRHGDADVAVAIGMDKHPRGAFGGDPAGQGLPDWYGRIGLHLTTHFFGTKINRYMQMHGISVETLARVAAKNLRNGELTPHAWRRKALSMEEIRDSGVVNHPLTRYMYCSPCEGAAAVVLCRGDLAAEFTAAPVYVRASELRSRRDGAFEIQSPSLPLHAAPSPTVDASRAAFEAAGLGPEDVQVAQLQDTDAGSEVIHLAENGFCADSEQEQWIADGVTGITGRLPVNTDGGLIANGEPIGASGLRQIYELVHQLQGRAGDRQVAGTPRVGYAHLYGSPGASAVTVLSR